MGSVFQRKFYDRKIYGMREKEGMTQKNRPRDFSALAYKKIVKLNTYGDIATQCDILCKKLKECPTGHEYFATYEAIGNEILPFLFREELGSPRIQKRTIDGVQRRDTLLRNKRGNIFFCRIADRFDADFIIVDFKNYSTPIGPDLIYDVAKYSNKALGKFILIISRKGSNSNAIHEQIRIFRDQGIVVLVLSDDHLVELLMRKAKGEAPADIIEDVLDEFLTSF